MIKEIYRKSRKHSCTFKFSESKSEIFFRLKEHIDFLAAQSLNERFNESTLFFIAPQT